MGNKTASKIVQGPAWPPDKSAKDVLCEAYMPALAKWCKDGGANGDRQFNDYLLNEVPGDLRRTLRNASERGVGIVTTNGTAIGLHRVAARVGAAGERGRRLMGQLAGRVRRAGRGLRSFRLGGANRIRGTRNGLGAMYDIDRALMADFVDPRDGTPIEVKRPTEPESHDGQLNNYEKASPTGNCDKVDCESCKLPCEGWTSDCPNPFPWP